MPAQATTRNGRARGLIDYEPLPGPQTAFHKSRAAIRLICGGHASGKSFAACAALADEVLNHRRRGSGPVHAWVVRPTFAINPRTDPVFTRLWFGDENWEPFIPVSMQKGIAGRGHVLELSDGSSITARSWGQRASSYAGEAPDIILIDEECPDRIYAECRARLPRKAHASMIINLTGVEGRVWVEELLHEAARGDGYVEVFHFDTDQNVHLSKQQVTAAFAHLDSTELAVRKHGKSRRQVARAYRMWGPGNWRDPRELPEGADYVLIDVGIGSATAALWIRVTPPTERTWADPRTGETVVNVQSDYWIHREYCLAGEPSVRTHVENILRINSELVPVQWFIDPHSARARVPHAGNGAGLTVLRLYQECGLSVTPMLGDADARVLDRLRLAAQFVDLDDPRKPNLYATTNLENLRRELSLYVLTGVLRNDPYDSKTNRERLVGPHDLIYLAEMCCVMELPYVATAKPVIHWWDHLARVFVEQWDTSRP